MECRRGRQVEATNTRNNSLSSVSSLCTSYLLVQVILFEHVFVALQYINLSCETMNISNLDAPGDPNTPCRGIMFLLQLYYHASNRREY